MKKIIISLFTGICFVTLASAQVQFTTVKHSFGKIKQNVPVSYAFVFKNTAAKPAVVEIATAECGCTTPEYPKIPIAKNATGQIKVTFNAATPGSFSKKVNVKFANADEPVVLTIEGEVAKKE
jgi:Protein of unknown function (DUF1573).